MNQNSTKGAGKGARGISGPKGISSGIGTRSSALLLAMALGVGTVVPPLAAASLAATAASPIELAYGPAPLQKLDYYRPSVPAPAASSPQAPIPLQSPAVTPSPAPAQSSPLVVFVHGGAWNAGDKRNATGQEKIDHFLAQGYAFASLNYRLIPSCTVEEQAQDVASALAFLLAHTGDLGFDPSRVVLMGHSAGAHLAALVGTDMRYLAAVGLGPDALRGIVLLDGAAYDVPYQVDNVGKMMQRTYLEAFGKDESRQLELSPIHHADAPNVAAFLILHVQRPDSIAQSNALASALNAAGTNAQVIGFDGKGLAGHLEINRRLGDLTYPATSVVDQWLASVFRTDSSKQ